MCIIRDFIVVYSINGGKQCNGQRCFLMEHRFLFNHLIAFCARSHKLFELELDRFSLVALTDRCLYESIPMVCHHRYAPAPSTTATTSRHGHGHPFSHFASAQLPSTSARWRCGDMRDGVSATRPHIENNSICIYRRHEFIIKAKYERVRNKSSCSRPNRRRKCVFV